MTASGINRASVRTGASSLAVVAIPVFPQNPRPHFPCLQSIRSVADTPGLRARRGGTGAERFGRSQARSFGVRANWSPSGDVGTWEGLGRLNPMSALTARRTRLQGVRDRRYQVVPGVRR